MENKINELFDEIVKSELENLKDWLKSPEEKRTTVEYLVKLNDIQTERKEVKRKETELELKHLELEDKIEVQSDDKVYKEVLVKREMLQTFIKGGIEVFGVVAPIMFYSAWMKRGLRFEETGTYTSQTFKGLFGKFKPTKWYW